MKCPKCQGEMEIVTIENIQLNRCEKCKGLWFDQFELSDLKEIKGSESVDIGKENIGKKYNKQDRLNCPKCNGLMIRMVDNDQPHIWYETCKACGGSFLDAGEFRDLIALNIVDKIKDFVIKLKGGREKQLVKFSPETIRKILQ